MGFVSGFAGGVTLTLAVAYYSVLSHQRNRKQQAASLRAQARTLNSRFEPQPPPAPTREELLRAERSSLLDTVKDRWNAEIERAARSIQNANWEEIKLARDEAIAKALGESIAATRHGIENAEEKIGEAASVIEEKAGKVLSEGKDKAAAKTSQVTEELSSKASQAAKEVPSRAEQLQTKASQTAKEVPHKAEQLQKKVVSTGAGTVDAARGAVRDAVSKGIEKGRELVGKTQDAVGTAASKVQNSEVFPMDKRSDAEKALAERYRPITSEGLDRTPEELLSERYKPIA